MMRTDEGIRAAVREAYGRVAVGTTGCCGGSAVLGYTEEELASVPPGADLGLGCGHPTALAGLAPGEVVVDLGSGPGLDAILAAQRVGPTGRVIGIDMTPEMIERARASAAACEVGDRIEFREGLIEHPPIEPGTADVVLSNCVVNLSPDPASVFAGAFDALRPGGRLAVSDILLTEPLPPEIAGLAEAHVACLAGASLADEYLALIEAAGFIDVAFERTPAADLIAGGPADPLVARAIALVGAEAVARIAASVWSYKITARKPA